MQTKAEKARQAVATAERQKQREARSAWSDLAEVTENMAQMLRRNVLRDEETKADVAIEVASRLRAVADNLEGRNRP